MDKNGPDNFSLSTKVIMPDIPEGKRLLAVSDIHAHGHLLARLLEKAAFSSEDILIIVGDILEKGPDSLGTLRYIMELTEKGNVFPLMGNVDAYTQSMIRSLSPENCREIFDHFQNNKNWHGSSFFHELAEECGLPLTSPEDALAAKETVLTRFSREFGFLEGLPTMLETRNFVFVHGGLRKQAIADNRELGLFELTKYDRFAAVTEHHFEKFVVVGHWPAALYRDRASCYDPVIDTDKRIISIDGGCGVKYDGQLNLLVIPHMDCENTGLFRCDGFPLVTALEDQPGRESRCCITWITRKIALLEQGPEFSLVRHLHSGKEVQVPTAYIENGDECRDYSDEILPVRKGEQLSLIFKTSKGIIAKRKGTVGWYFGAYRL